MGPRLDPTIAEVQSPDPLSAQSVHQRLAKRILTPPPYRHIYAFMKTTLALPDDLMTEVKVLAARERRKLGELMAELVQAGIESRGRQQPRSTTARQKARAWLDRWDRLSIDLSAALPASGESIVEEMIRDRDRHC